MGLKAGNVLVICPSEQEVIVYYTDGSKKDGVPDLVSYTSKLSSRRLPSSKLMECVLLSSEIIIGEVFSYFAIAPITSLTN
jgi:hypothetical protein